MAESFDIAIIGAGIVGLATARALNQRAPQRRIVVLDKEPTIAAHQTGHNSGVIHQGIYYKPGSLKAELSVRGARQMVEFCAGHSIPVQRVGKVIVATMPEELPRLAMLYERAMANGVPGAVQVDQTELKEIEPHAAGVAAIYSPNTAIVDYKRVAAALRTDLEAQGVVIQTRARVAAIQSHPSEIHLRLPDRTLNVSFVVNCAGLYADHIAQACGLKPTVRIVPFRGEYYFIKPARAELVRGLIYPVTDPNLPFLGVHFTRTVGGAVEAGPNAVFALAREGYGWRRVNVPETLQTLTFPGFWRMTRRWWKTGAFEFYRSLSKPAFVRSLQTLVPEIQEGDLERGGAGVRAQAVNTRGELLDDFYFAESARALHVLNAPSPAATASLAIGDYIAERVERMLG